jgi:hypothetical protein
MQSAFISFFMPVYPGALEFEVAVPRPTPANW